MRRLPLLLLICAVAALGVAGCGGDDNGGSDTSATATTGTTGTTTTEKSAGGGGTIEISADPGGDLAFQQKTVTAKSGSNKIEFTNQSQVPHDVKVEQNGKEIGGTDLVTGGNAEATVDLAPGKYTFFCSVPGHRQAGMEGTITVK